MTARLDLLAHGATAATRAMRFPNDEPLEPRALAALKALRSRFRFFDRVLTAPARAANDTAVALGLIAEIEPAIRECDYGLWRGLSLAKIEAGEPEALNAWLTDVAAAPHGGESTSVVIERTGAWLSQELTRRGATLAVTHASIVRAALVNALGANPASFWRVDVAPLSLVRLSGRDGRWNLVSLSALGAESP